MSGLLQASGVVKAASRFRGSAPVPLVALMFLWHALYLPLLLCFFCV
jgi:hypothetical protein